MKANLPKIEPEWSSAGGDGQSMGGSQASANRPRWILHDGPPYANGPLHMGTALTDPEGSRREVASMLATKRS